MKDGVIFDVISNLGRPIGIYPESFVKIPINLAVFSIFAHLREGGGNLGDWEIATISPNTNLCV